MYMLNELNEIGIPSTQSWLSENEAEECQISTTVKLPAEAIVDVAILDSAPVEYVTRLLVSENDLTNSVLLTIRTWSWQSDVMEALGAKRRRLIMGLMNECKFRQKPKVLETLLSSLVKKLPGEIKVNNLDKKPQALSKETIWVS